MADEPGVVDGVSVGGDAALADEGGSEPTGSVGLPGVASAEGAVVSAAEVGGDGGTADVDISNEGGTRGDPAASTGDSAAVVDTTSSDAQDSDGSSAAASVNLDDGDAGDALDTATAAAAVDDGHASDAVDTATAGNAVDNGDAVDTAGADTAGNAVDAVGGDGAVLGSDAVAAASATNGSEDAPPSAATAVVGSDAVVRGAVSRSDTPPSKPEPASTGVVDPFQTDAFTTPVQEPLPPTADVVTRVEAVLSHRPPARSAPQPASLLNSTPAAPRVKSAGDARAAVDSCTTDLGTITLDMDEVDSLDGTHGRSTGRRVLSESKAPASHRRGVGAGSAGSSNPTLGLHTRKGSHASQGMFVDVALDDNSERVARSEHTAEFGSGQLPVKFGEAHGTTCLVVTHISGRATGLPYAIQSGIVRRGSQVVAVNGRRVEDLTCQQVKNHIRRAARPVRITFRSVAEPYKPPPKAVLCSLAWWRVICCCGSSAALTPAQPGAAVQPRPEALSAPSRPPMPVTATTTAAGVGPHRPGVVSAGPVLATRSAPAAGVVTSPTKTEAVASHAPQVTAVTAPAAPGSDSPQGVGEQTTFLDAEAVGSSEPTVDAASTHSEADAGSSQEGLPGSAAANSDGSSSEGSGVMEDIAL